MALTKISSTAQMERVATDLEDIITRYSQAVGKLYDAGTELDSMWDGEAADKFKNIMSQDRAKFDALVPFLQRYIEALRTAISTYEDAERKSLEAISSNSVRTI